MMNKGWKTVLAEIEKCVLLCANCHGLRHVDQRVGDAGIEPATTPFQAEDAAVTPDPEEWSIQDSNL